MNHEMVTASSVHHIFAVYFKAWMNDYELLGYIAGSVLA
jgi:hypothetical protein